jgi:hypothetical protein
VSGLTIGSVNKSLYGNNLDAAIIVGAVWRIPVERLHQFCIGERKFFGLPHSRQEPIARVQGVLFVAGQFPAERLIF